MAWPGSHGPCFVSLPRLLKPSPNQTRRLSAARLTSTSGTLRQGESVVKGRRQTSRYDVYHHILNDQEQTTAEFIRLALYSDQI